jgi:hypothetical protein
LRNRHDYRVVLRRLGVASVAPDADDRPVLERVDLDRELALVDGRTS